MLAPIKKRLAEEDARSAYGEENATFEAMAEQLGEREIMIELACKVCGCVWEPGGAFDILSLPARGAIDGSLSAAAEMFKEGGGKLPRPLLLRCPECVEDTFEDCDCAKRPCTHNSYYLS
jgi:hypothetical protein